ncbi:MAG TPA: tetratricopeptide repeat protein [Candidatus Eisenbacteria bacterium]|nr:tetratricopeptide repeat protein [Candidatus Eisenbacteria bacterium]
MSLRRSVAFGLALAVAVLAGERAAWGRSPGQSALDEGAALYKRGRFADALASFRKAVDLDPGLTKAWENIGWSQHRLKNDSEALRVWNVVLKVEPGNVALWNAVGEVELDQGAFGRAAAALERSVRLAPKQWDIRLRLGEAYASLGQRDAAEAQYRAVLEARPADVRASLRMADLQRARGDLSAAQATLRAALARAPDSGADLWQALGDASHDAGDAAGALEAYRQAAAVDPRDAAAYVAQIAIALEGGDTAAAEGSLASMFATAGPGEADVVRAADLFIRDGAADAGVTAFERIALDPVHADAAAIALARLHAAQGGAAYRAGETSTAAAFYRDALAADPRNRAALRDYGWTLWREADWEGVRRAWERYAAAHPSLAEPHELLGRLALQRGEPARAVEEARRAIAFGGDSKGVQMLLTRAYLGDGKLRHARDASSRLAAAYPDDLPVQTLYAEALWRNLDFKEARDQWRKVIDMGNDTPRAMHYWLRSTYEGGAYEEAIAAAETAVTSGKASEPVFRLLAEDALVRDDDAGAIRWYRELTERYPERVAYWTALADVYRTAEQFQAQARTLREGLTHHPGSTEIRLLEAEAERMIGHPKTALAKFRALRGSLGPNRTVFEGELDCLRNLGRNEEALALLRSEGTDHFDRDERALTEALILEAMGRRAEAASARSGVLKPARRAVELPILLYHGIGDHPRTLNVPLERFEGEMRAIKRAGYTSITVGEMDRMLSGQRSFPDKPILITFDDARADSFLHADPVLQRLGMKATMFVPTNRIAEESAFHTDWPELARLAATGRWDFQAHGHVAHDLIAVDAAGGMAEFLVNREWLPDEKRLETHEEFVARVTADYESCRDRLRAGVPGASVVGYAFPFSEMGQLHGGNEPQALAVNEEEFRKLYRYGFIQDTSGYNTVAPGTVGPMILRRLGVRREWDGESLLAYLASRAPAARARLDAAEADIANAELRKAESDLRSMIAKNPRLYAGTGPTLALDLRAQRRERESARADAQVPAGPAWGRPDASRRQLTQDLAWKTDPQAGIEALVVSDSDGRDSFEAVATGRYPFEAPYDLWGSVGIAEFEDEVFESLSGPQGTIGFDWVGGKRIAAGAWLRGRDLGSGVNSIEGEALLRTTTDGMRLDFACGVTDVETVGALLDAIQRRGCQVAYEGFGFRWRSRARLNYGNLTDGNSVLYAWGDWTRALAAHPRVALGGRLEIGDSEETSPLYYAPIELVTALGVVRYQRSLVSGGSLNAGIGVGPSRDNQTSVRLVGQADVTWTQDWSPRWRSTLTGSYSQTPNYRRTGLGFAFGYRF